MSAVRTPTGTLNAEPVPVSVVIPCYRCAKTVRRAVGSIAGQTSPPAELILVDDGSRDDTLDVLRDIQRAFGEGWVTIVALGENRGVASARNAGWKRASGKYVAFLDADDTWHPRKVEVQFAFMQARPDITLSGHRHLRIADGTPLDRPLLNPGYRMISRGHLLLSNQFITPSVMVRRDIAHRFLEGARHMEDHLLWLEIASSGARIARLNEVLAFVYKRPFGESGLSADLVGMEKAELANYRFLKQTGAIGTAEMLGLCGYSLAKFARRMLIARLWS
jgi:glycosyltransferase involved in cell wall biosynthesis